MANPEYLSRTLAEAVLWGKAAPADRQPGLHALIDAAQDASIYPRLRRAGADAAVVPLYEGNAAIEMACVAPYLVGLGTGGPLFDWLFTSGFGRHWGVFVWSQVGIEALRAHFRTLTRVRTQDRRTLLFRFYDPRVLAAFLPTCDAAQVQEMFGPVEAFFAETEAGTAMTRFDRDGQGLRQMTTWAGER